MAVSNFQPTIWSSMILDLLYKNLTFGAPGVVNRNYEGEVASQGSSVKILGVGTPTVGTYTKDTDITINALTDSSQTLTIDQSKYFAFELDDVDAAQKVAGANIIAQATKQATYAIRDTIDQYLATTMKTGVNVGNALGAETVNSADTAYNLLVDLSVTLDNASVPSEGRWVIVTPALHAYMLKDARFINAQAYGSTEPIRNGRVGQAVGFDVYKSVNVAAGASTGKIITAGYGEAVTFASQISKVEAGRMEKRFADYVKGLSLYGAKVVRDTGIATADVTVS